MSRKPDFILKAVTVAEPAKRTRVGAAYLNSNGSLSLFLDPFIVLEQKPGEYRFMLYPFGGVKDDQED